MKIEDVMSDILEEYLKGKKIYHIIDTEYSNGAGTCFMIRSADSVCGRVLFRHKNTDLAASRYPVVLTMQMAVEVIKKYWEGRIEQ